MRLNCTPEYVNIRESLRASADLEIYAHWLVKVPYSGII